MNMLKYIFLIIGVMLSSELHSQIRFTFESSPSVGADLKAVMDNNISALLTEINRAGMNDDNLNLSGINMEDGAKDRLNALWQDSRIICNATINRSKCLEDYQGFQARDISVTMRSVDGSQSEVRELTVSLNKKGVITGVRPAWEFQESKESILKSSSAVTDTRERYEILKWVEDFRCYYNEKNLKALGQIYSDDALIITGSVVMQRKNSSDFNTLIENSASYKVQSKEVYLNRLASVFKSNRRVKVEFDNIEVRRHGSRPHIYGVTLRQKWSTDSYHDEGWLFLLWDFNNPDYPQIYVRTWQPLDVEKKDRPNVYSFPYSN